ncbi:hypothetical protein ACM64Y_11040 [Novispirillum sp. DQ9]|uniref:Bbp19 family protein n=1 Tax=Novispirillum sp. DQ9 TaxID=3398612 RepID=UPI003C7AA092
MPPPDAAPWPFDGAPAPAAEEGDGLAAAFARCFAGGDGRRVLDHLRAMTLHRALGPAAPDAALRHLEGQRALVAHVLALVMRGGGEI